MGLEATVYCNCFETERLNEPPPYPEQISIASDGSLNFGRDDLDITLALDRWLRNRACLHRNGILLQQPIGNQALIAFLRTELSREADKFPVLLKQVLYNGVHCGDYLSLDDVVRLRSELVSLESFVCSESRDREFVESFRRQMRELADASLSVSKPISF